MLRYGLRWIAESAFSWLKRVFGEYVTAKKLENRILTKYLCNKASENKNEE